MACELAKVIRWSCCSAKQCLAYVRCDMWHSAVIDTAKPSSHKLLRNVPQGIDHLVTLSQAYHFMYSCPCIFSLSKAAAAAITHWRIGYVTEVLWACHGMFHARARLNPPCSLGLSHHQDSLHGPSASSSLHSPNSRCLWKMQHSASNTPCVLMRMGAEVLGKSMLKTKNHQRTFGRFLIHEFIVHHIASPLHCL